MIKIGIIGAENSHCAAIAKICNIEKALPCRVEMVWGETRKFAKAAAEAGKIPVIVRDWRAMLGKVDGVMIDHRHPAFHVEPAEFFLAKRVPCFVDKPLAFTLRDARRLCVLAAKKRVAMTSFSIIPLQESFSCFKRDLGKGKIFSVSFTGPADVKSRYGGIFFYGIHQVEALVDLCGTDIEWAALSANKQGAVGTISFKGGPLATMNFTRGGWGGFHWSAVTGAGIIARTYQGDANPYLAGAKMFFRMFRTGRAPYGGKRMLASVAALEAMAKSLAGKGRRVRVAPL